MKSPTISTNMANIIATVLFMSSVFVKVSSQSANGSTNGLETGPFNLAEEVDEDFPIIFNILLWLGISLTIATLAICVSIATMDPGRDSLIYRVTSGQRFKKDN